MQRRPSPPDEVGNIKRARVELSPSGSSSVLVLARLPPDVIGKISAYFPLGPRLLVMARVCKAWRSAVLRSISSLQVTTKSIPLLSSMPDLQELNYVCGMGSDVPIAVPTTIRSLVISGKSAGWEKRRHVHRCAQLTSLTNLTSLAMVDQTSCYDDTTTLIRLNCSSLESLTVVAPNGGQFLIASICSMTSRKFPVLRSLSIHLPFDVNNVTPLVDTVAYFLLQLTHLSLTVIPTSAQMDARAWESLRSLRLPNLLSLTVDLPFKAQSAEFIANFPTVTSLDATIPAEAYRHLSLTPHVLTSLVSLTMETLQDVTSLLRSPKLTRLAILDFIPRSHTWWNDYLPNVLLPLATQLRDLCLVRQLYGVLVGIPLLPSFTGLEHLTLIDYSLSALTMHHEALRFPRLRSFKAVQTPLMSHTYDRFPAIRTILDWSDRLISIDLSLPGLNFYSDATDPEGIALIYLLTEAEKRGLELLLMRGISPRNSAVLGQITARFTWLHVVFSVCNERVEHPIGEEDDELPEDDDLDEDGEAEAEA